MFPFPYSKKKVEIKLLTAAVGLKILEKGLRMQKRWKPDLDFSHMFS